MPPNFELTGTPGSSAAARLAGSLPGVGGETLARAGPDRALTSSTAPGSSVPNRLEPDGDVALGSRCGGLAQTGAGTHPPRANRRFGSIHQVLRNTEAAACRDLSWAESKQCLGQYRVYVGRPWSAP